MNPNYLDSKGRQTGFEDVFTKIDRARVHYESVGLGAAFADRLIR